MGESRKKFTLFWLDGKREIVEGRDIADAFMRAGYGGGAIRALDFYADGENHEWTYGSGRWTQNDAPREIKFSLRWGEDGKPPATLSQDVRNALLRAGCGFVVTRILDGHMEWLCGYEMGATGPHYTWSSDKERAFLFDKQEARQVALTVPGAEWGPDNRG